MDIRDAIADVLRKYFQYNDAGEPNKEYDPSFAASDAIDEIHAIVGRI